MGLLQQLAQELDGATVGVNFQGKLALLQEGIMFTDVILNVTVVAPNDPPQYNGPSAWPNQQFPQAQVVGGSLDLGQFISDPNGDPVTVTNRDGNPAFSVTAQGVITWLAPIANGQIVLRLDDGRG